MTVRDIANYTILFGLTTIALAGGLLMLLSDLGMIGP